MTEPSHLMSKTGKVKINELLTRISMKIRYTIPMEAASQFYCSFFKRFPLGRWPSQIPKRTDGTVLLQTVLRN
ncbi:hypothetical protein KIN20_013681 [Parelaphostrongylus tenuis]|uniref:Uncharacterized protein n=1 Tax=Parelaphostrongylus tenuis TaxID=148309 RepID=A0AAD5MCG7_PARTN|nr:hypothetical protein KIN20_013681 [Parelaphostrongylus tenuis]